MRRFTLIAASCGLAGLLLACAGGGGETSQPAPAELTNPIAFGTSDPVQALHWLINAYDPVLHQEPGTRKAESAWQKKLQRLRGTQVFWMMEVGRISEGKVRPVRPSHPSDDATQRDNPNLSDPGRRYTLEPLVAAEPPGEFFEVTGVPEWLQQVQVGTQILLTGTIRSIEAESRSDAGKSLLRFKVLLDSAVVKHP